MVEVATHLLLLHTPPALLSLRLELGVAPSDGALQLPVRECAVVVGIDVLEELIHFGDGRLQAEHLDGVTKLGAIHPPIVGGARLVPRDEELLDLLRVVDDGGAPGSRIA